MRTITPTATLDATQPRIILAGVWLAIGHIVSGVVLCITIIGIPFGIANFKMVPISLTPLGREIVPVGSYGAAGRGVVVPYR